MPKAIEVAQELRKLADALDKGGETIIPQAAVYLSNWLGNKETFLDTVRLLPHPLAKEVRSGNYYVGYKTDALECQTYIEQSKVCILKEPARAAVYECTPLLSEAEEDSLTAA